MVNKFSNDDSDDSESVELFEWIEKIEFFREENSTGIGSIWFSVTGEFRAGFKLSRDYLLMPQGQNLYNLL